MIIENQHVENVNNNDIQNINEQMKIWIFMTENNNNDIQKENNNDNQQTENNNIIIENNQKEEKRKHWKNRLNFNLIFS